jgi:hypothetical protein
VVAVALNVLLYFGYFLPRMAPLIAHISPIGISVPEAISKSLSENLLVKLEQRRISPRMALPIVTVLEGDASYERGYHTEEGGLLPPSKTPVEETQEVPPQTHEKEHTTRW